MALKWSNFKTEIFSCCPDVSQACQRVKWGKDCDQRCKVLQVSSQNSIWSLLEHVSWLVTLMTSSLQGPLSNHCPLWSSGQSFRLFPACLYVLAGTSGSMPSAAISSPASICPLSVLQTFAESLECLCWTVCYAYCSLEAHTSLSVVSEFATLCTSATRLSCPRWDFPRKNIGVVSHFLLQGPSWLRKWTCISWNSCTGSADSLSLSHLGSPTVL